MPPSHWPANVAYSESGRHVHSSVSAETLAFILGWDSPRRNVNLASVFPTEKAKSVVIKSIKDTTHPAHGQQGLFALKHIPSKALVLYYFGEMHCDDRPLSNYDLSLYRGDGCNLGIDASAVGNEGRFVNDYRSIADKPNAIFVDERTEKGELRMCIKSIRLRGNSGIIWQSLVEVQR